jgi:AcrR family transcriptional regulator
MPPVVPESRSARTPSTVESNDSNVPDLLIKKAIELYGERGCQAVSGREIIRQAEILNEAAIRYYFGNKQGLLQACMASIAVELEPIIASRWLGLEQRREANQGITPRAVVTALLGGMITMYFQHPNAVRLIARMIREEGTVGQDMLLKELSTTIELFECDLAKLLPQKTPKALRLHSFLAFNSIVNGLVDMPLLERLKPVEEGTTHFKLQANELMKGFIDYITAGVSSSSEL